MKKVLMISLIVAAGLGLAGCEGHAQTKSSHGHNNSGHNSHTSGHHSTGHDYSGHHYDGPVEYVEEDVHSDVH